MAKRKYTADDFLYQPIMNMLDDDDGNVTELPGCCGVHVIHNFEEPDLKSMADNANYDLEEEIEAELTTRKEVLAELRGLSPMICATTIPSQRYANRVLPLLGFVPSVPFMGNNQHKITFWKLVFGRKITRE